MIYRFYVSSFFYSVGRGNVPRFSANLTFLQTEFDCLNRFEWAAEAGFTAVEYSFPSAYEAGQLAAMINRSKRQKKGWNG